MAGEITQTRLLQDARQDALYRSSHKGTQSENIADAKTLSVAATIFEDETAKVIRHGTVMVNDAFTTFDNAYRKMLAREIEVEGRVKAHTAILKDKANQIADAIGKINKLSGPDFEDKLQRLERFAKAVDTLDRLNKTGKLAECAKALSGLNGS